MLFLLTDSPQKLKLEKINGTLIILFHVSSNSSRAATAEFLSKIPDRKQISNDHFNLCEVKISLDEILKSINPPQKNNKFSSDDGLTTEFYKHFSNELASVLLDVYDSWRNLGTMSVTSRTGIISFIYKKSYKKDIANYRPICYNS